MIYIAIFLLLPKAYSTLQEAAELFDDGRTMKKLCHLRLIRPCAFLSSRSITTRFTTIGTILAVSDRVEDGHERLIQERRSFGKRRKPEALPPCKMEKAGEGGGERYYGKGESR